ncbi:hypothetical protein [Marinobacterium weihaiense]|uniref:DNA replication terminus site binding protein n=1 Tax=Marinobacterium weihaiense TaxID=2851016 RepID=A0ABS6ME50_9GAMM|nr:hypothetical protein [Marinobacterium weihaiense]MBV0934144.1 hypothetical protein [Marinobacterium weihaiense]
MDTMSEHITRLRDACQALIKHTAVTKDAILDYRHDMWCAVPTFDVPVDLQALQNTEPSSEAWYRVADEITNIWMDAGSAPQNHGVLVCSVSDVLDTLIKLNHIKQEVQHASQALKDNIYKSREQEELPLDDELLDGFAVARAEFLNRGRDYSFHQILKGMKLPSLNFIRAQKKVRMLENTVVRIAYTWNKIQYRKRLIDRRILQALSAHFERSGNHLRSVEICEAIESYQVDSSAPLYLLAHTPPTLRANYKWWNDELSQYQWSHCLATGMLVVPQVNRPEVRWKPAPSPSEIKQAKAKWLRNTKLQPVEIATRLELFRNAG